MEQIEIRPLRRSVSCLGLGCGRLVGRSSLLRSARIVEAALDLGITYFDVAPMYGDGTAEEVLGHVVGDSSSVVVSTKVGQRRPLFDARKHFVKGMIKPTLDHFRGLKVMIQRALPKIRTSVVAERRHDFSFAGISESLEISLTLLKRSQIDFVLAHDPILSDLQYESLSAFQTLVNSGMALNFGVGVDNRTDSFCDFGEVWQSGWPGAKVKSYSGNRTYIFHGVLRYAERDKRGRYLLPVGKLISNARKASPGSVILVSASTPRRLRELVHAAREVGSI